MRLARLYRIVEARESWIRSRDVYHATACARISQKLEKGQRFTLKPSIPLVTEPYEDNSTPRVSFCRTPDECLNVLPGGLFVHEDFYLFQPIRPILLHVTAPAWDAIDTADRIFRSASSGREYDDDPQDELWAFDPVDCVVVGIFEYLGDGEYQEIPPATQTQVDPPWKRPPRRMPDGG